MNEQSTEQSPAEVPEEMQAPAKQVIEVPLLSRGMTVGIGAGVFRVKKLTPRDVVLHADNGIARTMLLAALGAAGRAKQPKVKPATVVGDSSSLDANRLTPQPETP